MSPRSKFAGGLIGLGALSAMFWLIGGQHGDGAPGPVSASAVPRPSTALSHGQTELPAADVQSVGTAGAQKSPLVPQPQSQPISVRLRQELLASRDWRAFAISAMARPQEGGYFYALYATNLCGRDTNALRDAAANAVGTAVASKGTVSAETLAAVDRIVAACASFASGEARELRASVKAMAKDGQDPLVAANLAVEKALAAGDRDVLRNAVGLLFATGDPLAVSSGNVLNRVMASNSGADRKDGQLWFNGKAFGTEDGREYSAVLLAAQMAVCQQDAPCALDDQLSIACVSGGDCTAGRLGYIKSQLDLAGADAPTFERVSSLAGAMRAALASGNVGAFIR